MSTDTAHATDHDDVHDDEDHWNDEGHWTDLNYIKLALALAVITAIEVAISYMVDDLGPFFLPLLLGLMLIKFFSVVLFFMHLKFDNRLFSLMFYLGLGLAVAVYTAALFTFKFFSP